MRHNEVNCKLRQNIVCPGSKGHRGKGRKNLLIRPVDTAGEPGLREGAPTSNCHGVTLKACSNGKPRGPQQRR